MCACRRGKALGQVMPRPLITKIAIAYLTQHDDGLTQHDDGQYIALD